MGSAAGTGWRDNERKVDLLEDNFQLLSSHHSLLDLMQQFMMILHFGGLRRHMGFCETMKL